MQEKLPVVDSLPESLTEEIEETNQEEERIRPQYVKDRIKNYKKVVQKRRIKNKAARKSRRVNRLKGNK